MTFTITCAECCGFAPIHNRTPVVLDERADDWMNPLGNPRSLKRSLIPAPDDALIASPAVTAGHSEKNNGPELLAASSAMTDENA